MTLYHKYRATGVQNPTNLKGPLHIDDSCPGRMITQDDWYQRISNHNASRGVLNGIPTAESEAAPLGCFDYSESLDWPDPKTVILLDTKVRTKSKAADFHAAQKRGDIVLNPMSAREVKARFVPGVSQWDRPVGTRNVPIKVTPSVYEYIGSFCDSAFPAYAITDVGGVPWRRSIVRSWGDPQLIYTLYRVFDTYEDPTPAFPPDSLAKQLHSAIEKQLREQPQDKGLLTSAIAEANEGNFDFLTEVGEAKETIKYIFGFLREALELYARTSRSVKQMKRRPGQSMAQFADEITSIWMQYRYAVMPLTYTVEDAFAQLASSFFPYQTVRRGSSWDLTLPEIDGWRPNGAIKVIDRVYVKTRFGADMVTHGLKMNPFSTAWELTPLSFVVDWFLNVGDVLTAMLPPSNVAQRAVGYSRQIRDQQVLVQHETGTKGHLVLNLRTYDFNVVHNPLANIGFTIDPSMTWKRWLDALSLSWGQTKGLLKR